MKDTKLFTEALQDLLTKWAPEAGLTVAVSRLTPFSVRLDLVGLTVDVDGNLVGADKQVAGDE